MQEAQEVQEVQEVIMYTWTGWGHYKKKVDHASGTSLYREAKFKRPNSLRRKKSN